MNAKTKRRINQAIASVVLFCMATQTTFAALLNFAQAPLFIGANIPPKVMLTISKDQQLYKKAYNDYTDLDGDGIMETTYKHTVSYYGYFDPVKCYSYSTANGRFEPQLVVTGPDKDGNVVPVPATCTGMWSGNFLNWISMSRIDAVRKLLYGGMRSTDTTADTVLERAYLPTDAHAWAKYYNPPGDTPEQPAINKVTPFSSLPTATTSFTATTSAPYNLNKATADVTLTFTADMSTRMALGDQICVQKSGAAGVCNVNAAAPADAFFIGAVMNIAGSGRIVTFRINAAGVIGTGSSSTWTVTNLSATGISFCNLTRGNGSSGNLRSSTNANPPLIRVAKGNFGLWNANERWQCQWSGEQSNLQAGFNGVRSNGNQASLSEINSSAENPSQTANGLGTGTAQGEYIARVLACSATVSLQGTERCKQYPSGNYKPAGLLQVYGDDQRLHFGLMTGSYQKNISGGVLRKNTDAFTDEVRTGTNGSFTGTAGIVSTLDGMRIYGYYYGDGTYLSSSVGDTCDYQLTSITEGRCTSWGNPMSEVFYEAIRYFAGQKPTAAYQYTDTGSKDKELGLPLVTSANWKDPVSQATYCSPLNVLVFNASVSTNDDDLRTTSASQINSSDTIGGLTTKVGINENLAGPYFIGKINGVSNSTDDDFELCTPKPKASGTVTLGDASGICPEGPTLSGSFLIGGIAHHAKANAVRKDITVPATDTKSLKVTSYGIQLATNVPQISLPIPGGGGRTVVIQPIYRLDLGTSVGGGALVDMKFVRQSTVGSVSTGKVYITWEDSEQGGDYDQDMWGTLEWTLDAAAGTIKITTNAVSASTINPQGFGYTISGTTQDGPHFHSGILGFNFPRSGAGADPQGVLGCTNCQAANELVGQRGPTTFSYSLGTTAAAGTLKDPLWYLAKYGGFTDINGDGVPNDPAEWDTKTNFSGGQAADGEPDNYFLVTNPIQLDAALDKVFAAVGLKSSASSVASNSTSLKTGSAVYNARFDSGDWSGDLRAFLIGMDGSIGTVPTWEAAKKIPAPGARTILTFNEDPASRKGVAFRWPSGTPTANDISSNMIAKLNVNPDTNLTDSRGKDRLAFLRGDRTNEGVTTPAFRKRNDFSVMGDIVNSNPAYVAEVPNDVNLDASYNAFRTQFATTPRTPMVYVGGNDGMVHGFDATPSSAGGIEKLAYVPSKVANKLNQLTSKTYIHRYYVDASADTADVQAGVGGAWKTVLVGGLGAGGQGLYALDVTDPSKFAENNGKTVLWEFNDTDDAPVTGYPGYGLGYVFGQPVIRKMANGKWAAIVSGGYNNSEADGFAGNGHAFLFVFFLDGPSLAGGKWKQGTDYVRIDTGVGTVATPNGLAPPFAADVDADGKVDFVFAGDLQGNFWKFDLRDATPGNWASSSNRVRMFIAKNSSGQLQPITGRAEGTPHPSGQGFVITFGTGKYMEPTDPVSPYRAETFYGVWDKNDKLTNIASQSTRDIQRSQLFEQIIDTSGTFRSIKTSAGPDWGSDWGWFMDFPNGTATGERSVFKPLLLAGRLIFTTLIPSGGACEFGGTSFLMVVSPTTGGSVNAAVLDVNGDKQLNTADMLSPGVYASGVQSAVGITPTPTVIAGRSIQSAGTSPGDAILGTSGPLLQGFGSLLGYMIIAGSNGNMDSSVVGLSNNSGRVSWREILKD